MQEIESQQLPGIKLWFLCFHLIMSNMYLYGCVGRATQLMCRCVLTINNKSCKPQWGAGMTDR